MTPKLEWVTGSFTICSACLDGEGGECHTAGCVMWLNRAPDLPLRANLLMHDCRIEDLEARASVSGAPAGSDDGAREPRRGCSVCGVTSLCRHIVDGSGEWVDLGRRNEDTRPDAGIVCLVCMTRPATRYATAADGTGLALCAECRLDDEARGLGDAWLKDYADAVAAPASPSAPGVSAGGEGGE